MSDRIANGYREFAEHDGRVSPLYAELATGVAGDREILDWLDGLPVGKRQPNLLFAGYRAVAGMPSGWPEFRVVLGKRRDEVEALMLERRTQTNEPARCALLLPLLAALPQPLALLEVGTSAGLCLLPDHYSYDYDGHRLGNGSPTLRCTPEGPVPLPVKLPEIVWRAGLDLEPIDIDDPERVRWLELLIWPGEEYRVDVLHRALAVARAERPRVVQGDLTTSDLDDLAAEAPRDATLVIFHTAVLYYVPSAGRARFRDTVKRLGATWIACEAHNVLGLEPGPEVPSGNPSRSWRARSVPSGNPSRSWRARSRLMALARDGERVAWADGHGTRLSWG